MNSLLQAAAVPNCRSKIKVSEAHKNETNLGHTQRLPESLTRRVQSAAAKSPLRAFGGEHRCQLMTSRIDSGWTNFSGESGSPTRGGPRPEHFRVGRCRLLVYQKDGARRGSLSCFGGRVTAPCRQHMSAQANSCWTHMSTTPRLEVLATEVAIPDAVSGLAKAALVSFRPTRATKSSE